MRKKFLFIILIVISLFYGVNVNAKGNIEIENISVKETEGSIIVDDLAYENNTVTSNITFTKLNDSVVFNIKLKNNTNNDYTLDKLNNNINNDHILIETNSKNKVFKKGSSETITVKLKYNKELLEGEDIKISNASLELVFNPTVINPKTASNVIILIIAIVLIITTTLYVFKSKKVRVGIFALLLLIPVYVYAAGSTTQLVKFNNITIKKVDVKMNLNPEYFFMTADESMDVLIEILREWGRPENEIQEEHIDVREGYTDNEILQRYLEDFHTVAYDDMYQYFDEYVESKDLTDEEYDSLYDKRNTIMDKWEDLMEYLETVAYERGNEGLKDPTVQATANEKAEGIYEYFDEINMLDKRYGDSFINEYYGDSLIEYGKTKTASGADIDPDKKYFVNGYGDILESQPNPHTYRMHFVRVA